MKTPVTQEKTRRRHGRIGAQQNGPEPVREHQPGPTQPLSDQRRDSPMLARTKYEVLRHGRRDFDREAFVADHAHLDPLEAKDWLRFELSRFAKRPPISPALRRAVYARDGHACVRCGSTERLSIDHIHPYSRGGEAVLENLQTLCLSCNCRKGDKV